MEAILGKLGLSKTEITLYLALLPIGSAPASVLAYRTGILVGTARQACLQLVKKGLLRVIKKDNTLIFTPESPERILYLLEEESRKVEEKKDEANRIIGNLKAMINPGVTLPKVKFFTGKDGLIEFCNESLQCKEKEILFATSMDHFRNVVSEEYDVNQYIPTRLKRQIKLKLLCVHSPLSKKMHAKDKQELRETGFLPKEFPIKNTLFIFDDVTTLVSNETFPSCIMIHSKEITETMRTFFNFAWRNAKRK